jgi:uncharacterized membrane protein YeaQ/YmgE (transglycosylase-associated protein family)
MADLQPYMPYIIMALNGLVAGWLAGLLLGGGGLIRNLFVGIIGAFVGGFLVNSGMLQLPASVMAYANMVPYGPQILISTIGALLVIIVARIIGR